MDSAPIAAPDLSPFLRIVKSICGLQSYGRRAGDARLISIRYSHYNERARWALDLSPLPYTEDAHPPGFAQFAIQDVTDGRKSASPVLVLPDGEVLDSTNSLPKNSIGFTRAGMTPRFGNSKTNFRWTSAPRSGNSPMPSLSMGNIIRQLAPI